VRVKGLIMWGWRLLGPMFGSRHLVRLSAISHSWFRTHLWVSIATR